MGITQLSLLFESIGLTSTNRSSLNLNTVTRSAALATSIDCYHNTRDTLTCSRREGCFPANLTSAGEIDHGHDASDALVVSSMISLLCSAQRFILNAAIDRSVLFTIDESDE
jgi:hypothetical protein